MDDRCMMVLFLIILHVFHGNVVFARELELVKLQGLMFYQYVLKRKNMCIMPRVAPDIRPFLISGIRPDIRFRLSDIRLAGYPARKTLHGIFFLQNLGLH